MAEETRDGSNCLTVNDDRTGESYRIEVTDGTIKAADLKQIPAEPGNSDAGGLATYDPGFVNTASCRSAITFIDGDKGVLEYRGYPIEQLAEESTFLEVSFLLVKGYLPTQKEYDDWVQDIGWHTLVPETVKDILSAFHYDAHPMGVLMSMVASLSTFYPEANQIKDEEVRDAQIVRLIAKMPTLAAYAYRHAIDRPYVEPHNELDYITNFMSMLWKRTETKYETDPRLVKAMEALLILHADHEQNCSTNAVRAIASSGVDPYSAVAGGVGALYGPLHGGANEAVLRMLRRIKTVDHIPDFIDGVKNHEERLMGFGHRVYKQYDPRATIIKKAADDVFDVVGVNPLLKVAQELEKIALEDDYFISRKLYPNVDFYSGLIYEALQFPAEMFPVLFAIGRTPGWAAQWNESVVDPDNKIARPKQIYTGERKLDYVPIDKR